MRHVKKKRKTPLVFPPGLAPEQRRALEEKRFMLDIIVPLDQRPKLAYLIPCFNCQQKTTFEIQERTPLTQDQLHMALIVQGWTIASKGYECPACLQRWVEDVGAFLQEQGTPIDMSEQKGENHAVYPSDHA